MKKIYNKLTLILFAFALIIVIPHVNAAVRLPSLIGNNMVLQQNAEINVWGWADGGHDGRKPCLGEKVGGKGGSSSGYLGRMGKGRAPRVRALSLL